MIQPPTDPDLAARQTPTLSGPPVSPERLAPDLQARLWLQRLSGDRPDPPPRLARRPRPALRLHLLRHLQGGLLALGLAPWIGRRAAGPVRWGGAPLAPGLVHHGSLRHGDALPIVLMRLDVDPGRLAIVDLDGIVDAPRLGLEGALFVRPAKLVEPRDLALALGLRGALDAAILVFDATLAMRADRARQGRALVEAVARLAPRPWIALGVGAAGHRDGLLRALRGAGQPRLAF